MTIALGTEETTRSDRFFFTGIAIAALCLVFVAFSPSFYMRSSTLPPLSPLLYVHGLVFTSWILLFATQATLVAADRRDLHRKLGMIGAIIAILVVGLGSVVAVDALRRGLGPVFGMRPGSFFSFPVEDISVFAILVTAGIFLRHHSDSHKRLMLLATISLLPAAIARVLAPFHAGIATWFLFADVFVVAAVVYDIWSRGRVHPTLIYGGLLIVAAKPLLVMASGTSVWLSFAKMFE